MIYTTYFAKLRSLPNNVVPVAICAKTPDWYAGAQYRKLAPKYDFFMEWKRNHDEEAFRRAFKEQVTDKLDADSVVKELQSIVFDKSEDIALVCYEKSTDFCHRHLVAEWLRDNGYECEEYLF